MRRTVRRDAISPVRGVGGDLADFGRGELAPMAEPEGTRRGPVHVTPEEVKRFCEFLYRRTGMSFGEGKAYFIDRRLADRIAATGSPSFQRYFSLLRADADHEIEQLINSFTVNETYFYREDHQLRCMTANLLDGIVARKPAGEPIRIWSLPCSTGEEPYSIALWLMENWGRVDDYNIEIVGSDIDTRALKAAAEGIYGARALMRLPHGVVERYFTPVAGGRHQIDAGLRDSIEFTHANLIDRSDMARYRGFDLIFCRNVLIYFDDASRRQAAENLYDCLRPGGYICLGHSESMSRISPLFGVCRFPDAIVYQKPEADHG
jgi:chemotaxis protein methyltransferase CheR